MLHKTKQNSEKFSIMVYGCGHNVVDWKYALVLVRIADVWFEYFDTMFKYLLVLIWLLMASMSIGAMIQCKNDN